MVESLAVLSTMIKDSEIRWLKGEAVDPTELATLLNARRREALLVGVDIEPQDVTPDLASYLRARSANAEDAT